MWWWLAVSALGADCPVSVAPTEVGAVVDAAEAGFAAMASDVFADRLDEASLLLPCVDAVVPPSLAARWHGLVGLRLFTAGRTADAAASFASARSADPSWDLSERVVPAAHAVRSLVAEPVPAEVTPLDPPASGALFVDGTAATSRPDQRPAVVQWVDGPTVGFTAYVWPRDSLPAYPRAPVDAAGISIAPVTEAPPEAAGRHRPKWGWLAVGGVAASTSAVLYGLGAASHHRTLEGTLDPDAGRADLEKMQAHTNRLVASSGAAAAVATAGFVTFAVAW